MKKLFLYSFIVATLFSFSQDNRDWVVGRYLGVKKSTNTNTSTSNFCNDYTLDIIYDNLNNAYVTVIDSGCFSVGSWNGEGWDYTVNNDTTLVDLSCSLCAHGELFFSDSLYLLYTDHNLSSGFYYEFFGFKLYSTVGVNDLNEQENALLISPQPATDVIYVQSTQLVFRQEDIPVVYDISCKQHAIPMQYINKSTYKLDVSCLSVGMYVIAIKTEKGVVRKKVIVE